MADSANSEAVIAANAVAKLRRLGRNVNGYSGETIDITAVLEDCKQAASRHDWSVEQIQADALVNLLACHRKGRTEANVCRVYISAGIHGDEPAGPLAVHQLLEKNAWPRGADIWICPCLNPTGFLNNRRENATGTDLNRQYLQPQAKEIIAHVAWLEKQPAFDLCICLHEDWEAHGFYLYELNPDCNTSFARKIIERVAQVCPIDPSEIIEGRPARDGIIIPATELLSRTQWPEAFFLIMHKTRLTYTLEAPSDFPLSARVAALKGAVETAVECCALPSNQLE
jgi:protein MpaA